MRASDVVNFGSLRRKLEPLKRRLSLMVLRAVVTAVDDSEGRQLLQLVGLGSAPGDSVEHWQPLGLSAVPAADGTVEALQLALGGNQSNPAAVVVESRDVRPTGQAGGTTTLYDAGTGQVRIRLLADGTAEVVAERVKVEAGDVEVVADRVTVEADDVEVNAQTAKVEAGSVELGTATTIDGKVFLLHTHAAGALLGDGGPAVGPVTGFTGPVGP